MRPRPALTRDPAERPTLTGLLAGLSFALDLAEGQRFGHALRSTLIAMALGERLGLDTTTRRDLFQLMLVKDLGGPGASGAVRRLLGGDDRRGKHDLRRADWRHTAAVARVCVAHDADPRWLNRAAQLLRRAPGGRRLAGEALVARATHGVTRVRELGLDDTVAQAIGAIDGHWDGGGRPQGLAGSAIPLTARIASLAQCAEACLALDGPPAALAMAIDRRGRWFDPTLVTALTTLERELAAWSALGEHELFDAVAALEPGDATLLVSEARFERIASTYARVVDSRSAWSAGHSEEVARIGSRLATTLGLEAPAVAAIRRAALLHDLGKLALPLAILDKPGPLGNDEWEQVRRQPWYTRRILSYVAGAGALAEDASSHHERIDGRGYCLGLRGEDIPLAGRILAVADGFAALTHDRPFRGALPEEIALRLLARDRGIGIDADCHEALVTMLERGGADAQERAA